MWTITNDFTSDFGTVSCRIKKSSCNYDGSKAAQLEYRFRLLDADGEVYYEGLSDNCDSQRAFAPLDDFGRGFAGCVEIRYLTNGCWERI